MRLLRDQILIRPLAPEDELKNGIWMPPNNSAESRWADGEIVAIGEFAFLAGNGDRAPFPYEVGDRVQYNRFQVVDDKYEFDGEGDLFLTTATAVIGVYERELAVV